MTTAPAPPPPGSSRVAGSSPKTQRQGAAERRCRGKPLKRGDGISWPGGHRYPFTLIPFRFAMSAFARYFLACLFLITSTAYAQQTFEAGYVIDSGGRRTEVAILNEDWRFNPDEIVVRKSPGAEPVHLPTESLQEFSIPGRVRYVNREVVIEKSPTASSQLSTAAPVARKERVLLRVEVEGPADLYSYLAPQVTKFFLAVGGRDPSQLIYTRYLREDGKVAEADTYRRQLAVHLACGAAADYARVRYQLPDLRARVVAFNDCAADGSVVYHNAVPGAKSFYLTILPGLYGTHFRWVSESEGTVIAETPRNLVARLGVDVEFILPFGGNKFAVLARPSYYQFTASGTVSDPTSSSTFSVSYHALDLPFSVRYYSFLSERMRLFGTGSLGTTVPFGEVELDQRELFRMQGTISLAAEIGLRYGDRFLLALGYEKSGSTLFDVGFSTRTSGYRLMVGYSL